MDRFQKFHDHRIGLETEDLRLEPYNPRWKRLFSDEAYLIFDELRMESLRLYHIGSTAVEGLDSKPVLDILGSVESLEDLDHQRHRLEALEYDYQGEFGIPGRRYCVLKNPDESTSYVHLHLFERNHPAIENHLNFRNLLRESPEKRALYLKQKKYLVEEVKVPRARYSDEKSEVINQIQSGILSHPASRKVLAVLGAAEGHKNTQAFLQEIYGAQSLEIMDLTQLGLRTYSYSDRSADSFQNIIRKALASDLIVLATPVYWYAMSSSMKSFLDRFSNLMSGEHKILGESLYGKRVQLLSTGYDLKLPLGFEVPFAGTAIYFGMDYEGAHYRSVR
jgi:GrpB-like predicted nucleotidyltransferase (UPF0157 family)